MYERMYGEMYVWKMMLSPHNAGLDYYQTTHIKEKNKNKKLKLKIKNSQRIYIFIHINTYTCTLIYNQRQKAIIESVQLRLTYQMIKNALLLSIVHGSFSFLHMFKRMHIWLHKPESERCHLNSDKNIHVY